MTPMIYVGIDPGKTGAIAVLFPDRQPGLWNIEDIDGLARLGPQILVGLEDVSKIPKLGWKAAFSLGESNGWILHALTVHKIPYEQIPPKEWQRGLFRGKSKDPDATRLAALQKWPMLREELKRKKDGDKADALWLAEYLRRRESHGT